MDKQQIIICLFIVSNVFLFIILVFIIRVLWQRQTDLTQTVNETIFALNYQNYKQAVRNLKKLEGKTELTADDMAIIEASNYTIECWNARYRKKDNNS